MELRPPGLWADGVAKRGGQTAVINLPQLGRPPWRGRAGRWSCGRPGCGSRLVARPGPEFSGRDEFPGHGHEQVCKQGLRPVNKVSGL